MAGEFGVGGPLLVEIASSTEDLHGKGGGD